MGMKKTKSSEYVRLENAVRVSLIQLRLCANLTQEDVADLIGWTSQSVSMIERGDQRLTLLDVCVLCEAYCVPIDRLLSVALSIEPEVTAAQSVLSNTLLAVARKINGGFRDR